MTPDDEAGGTSESGAADADGHFDPAPVLKRLTSRPGVYRMMGEGEEVLYVGKARNLKKRVSSYFLRASGNPRIESMVDQVVDIQFTVTASEDKALLLENELIKAHRPRYNVALRDDKSYPLLRITDREFPRIQFHRGSQKPPDQYFGPFASAAGVRQTIGHLQKLFKLRTCDDSYYQHRSRPCLQHQIKRCSAPCVGNISAADYQRDLNDAIALIQGRAEAVERRLVKEMDESAEALEFEKAARLRDRIATLKRIQSQRSVGVGIKEADIVVAAVEYPVAAVVVHSIRAGQDRGHRTHYPKIPRGTTVAEVLEAFIGQFYSNHPPPAEILCNAKLEELEWLSHSLSEQSGHRVEIKNNLRSQRRQLLRQGEESLKQAMLQRVEQKGTLQKRWRALEDILASVLIADSAGIQRIECFDISHTQGESTVASCVVWNREGAQKSLWRRFNINGIVGGDDYAAMEQALTRRFSRLVKEAATLPDLLIIDGGAGQITRAAQVLETLDVRHTLILGIAKGPTRKPGLEDLLIPGHEEPLDIASDSPALHLLQQIRDDAHGFAIRGHRGQRGKTRKTSPLEAIPGLGPKRRQTLLSSFGGLQSIRRAGVEELAKTPGISRELATKIHEALR